MMMNGYHYLLDKLGHGGPLKVSHNQVKHDLIDPLLSASEELGIPRNPCYNSGNNYGKFDSVMA